jgi:hypothetical protein
MFDFIKDRLHIVREEARSVGDSEFLESSVMILDERLIKHYPMKGKTEVEVM